MLLNDNRRHFVKCKLVSFAFDNWDKMTLKLHDLAFLFLLRCFSMYPFHLYFEQKAPLIHPAVSLDNLLTDIPVTNCLPSRAGLHNYKVLKSLSLRFKVIDSVS